MSKSNAAVAEPPVAVKTEELVNETILNYIKAGYPLLWLVTHEESRAERDIVGVSKALADEASPDGRQLYAWSYTEGLAKYIWDKNEMKTKVYDKTNDPVAALLKMKDQTSAENIGGQNVCLGDIFIMRDLHRFTDKAAIVRHLRDAARDYKQKRKTIIIIAPTREMPSDLERDAVVVDFDLPSEAQVKSVWDAIFTNSIQPLVVKVSETVGQDKLDTFVFDTDDNGNTVAALEPTENDRVIQAARGLTSGEAENAFAMAATGHLRAVRDRAVAEAAETPEEDLPQVPTIASIVLKEKANAVRKTGILEYMEPSETMANIGGLENLKKWLKIRQKAFTKEARDFGLPFPRGIALTGLPGCGKSLAAKAAAALLGVPLIRFDVSRVFGGRVGQSEEQMRTTLAMINRVGHCVVWIDEAEKALAGMGGSGSGDSGTTKRVFGNLLTWMQEREPGAFMIMTMNDINAVIDVAPELVRKGGRVDEIFFVGLPSQVEVAEIYDIHIKKFGRNPEDLKINTQRLAAMTPPNFSGAEVQAAVEEGMFLAFHAGEELNAKHIIQATEGIVPLAQSQEKILENMVEWAKNNAVSASKPHKGDKGGKQSGRDLAL